MTRALKFVPLLVVGLVAAGWFFSGPVQAAISSNPSLTLRSEAVVISNVTCATTATAIPCTTDTRTQIFQNVSTNSATIFWGDSAVTTANGQELTVGGSSIGVGATGGVLSCIVASGTQVLRVLCVK